MNYLVYVVFNKDRSICNELVYSVLSLNHVASSWTEQNVTVLIYAPEEIAIPHTRLSVRFKKLDEHYVNDQIAAANGCSFVMKPVVLKNIFDQQEDAENILFVDTDTFFRSDVKPLFDRITSGAVVLHVRERAVKDRPVIHQFLTSHTFHSATGESCYFNEDFNIWNTGVIGLNSSYKNTLTDIISLISQLAQGAKWHVIDQVAFAYFFRSSNIVAAEEMVVHYWFYKLLYCLTARYFNVYVNDDIRSWLKEHDREIPAGLCYEAIPSLAVRLLSTQGYLLDSHFLDLPAGTFIGDLFRQHAVGVKIMPYAAPY